MYKFGSLRLPSSPFPFIPTTLEVTGTAKSKVIRSIGTGQLALYHHTDLGEAKILRGYESESVLNRRVPSFLSIKGDLYCDAQKSVIPGIFVDSAVFRSFGKQEHQRQVLNCDTRFSLQSNKS